VEAPAAGGGRGHDVALAVHELDGDAVDAGLARVLNAVAVDVVPDEIAQLGGQVGAGVHGEVAVAGGQGVGAGHAGARIGVAVDGWVSARVLGGEAISSG